MEYIKKNTQIWGLLLFLSTLALYASTLHFNFIYFDDPDYIFENPSMTQLGWPAFIKWAFFEYHSANWHPLTWISHKIDYSLFGFWAGGHHFTSTLLHSLNSLLVFIIFKRMTKCPIKSLLLAIIFAWHPVKVESVAWISERKDVLSTFFALFTFLFYAHYCEKKNTQNYVYSLLAFTFCLMSKGMYVTMPFILLLFDFWPLERFKTEPLKKIIAEKIPYLLLTIMVSVLVFLAQEPKLTEYPLYTRFLNSIISYYRYLTIFFWPQDLTCYYPYLDIIRVLPTLMAGGLLLIFSVFIFWIAKKSPYLFTGWFLFLGTLVPVIGVIKVGDQAMANRFLYFPSIGLSIICIWGGLWIFQKLNIKKTITTIICIAFSGLLLVGTSFELPYWQNTFSLYHRAIKIHPNNWFILMGLRSAYGRDGNHMMAANYLLKAFQVNSNIQNIFTISSKDFYFMGKLLFDRGEYQKSAEYFKMVPFALDGNTEILGKRVGGDVDKSLSKEEKLKIVGALNHCIHHIVITQNPSECRHFEGIEYLLTKNIQFDELPDKPKELIKKA